MGEILIPRRAGGSTDIVKAIGYELLADVTVSTATTIVAFNGLELSVEDEVLLVADFYNPTASDVGYRIFVNNNTATTNYYFQRINADGTSATGSRSNDSRIGYTYTTPSRYSQSITSVKLTNSGYFVAQSSGTYTYGGRGVYLSDRYTISTFTTSSITNLTIGSSATNAIGIGSRFQLYKTNGGVKRTWDTV